MEKAKLLLFRYILGRHVGVHGAHESHVPTGVHKLISLCDPGKSHDSGDQLSSLSNGCILEATSSAYTVVEDTVECLTKGFERPEVMLIQGAIIILLWPYALTQS